MRLCIMQAETLRAAVMRVATEPAFREAARVVGARMRAHRVTPKQRAAGVLPCTAPDQICGATLHVNALSLCIALTCYRNVNAPDIHHVPLGRWQHAERVLQTGWSWRWPPAARTS